MEANVGASGIPERARAEARRLNNLGVARRVAGDWTGALAAFRRAAAADDTLPEPLANAAAVFLLLGDAQRAARAAAAALQRDPEHPVAVPAAALADALCSATSPPPEPLLAFGSSELALILLGTARAGHPTAAVRVLEAAIVGRGEDASLLFAGLVIARVTGNDDMAGTLAGRLELRATELGVDLDVASLLGHEAPAASVLGSLMRQIVELGWREDRHRATLAAVARGNVSH